MGRFAIHTTRKRLLDIPDCRPFDIQNLGAYERQRWQQASGNGALRAYFDTILAFYRAEPVEGFAHLHGRKAGRMVHVGATDAPVTIDECEEVMDEMADNGIEACDLLGWEWEMGLHDTITEARAPARARPAAPPDSARGDGARGHRGRRGAFLRARLRRPRRAAATAMRRRVVLKDFAIPSEDLIPPKVREQIESVVRPDRLLVGRLRLSATRSSTTSGRRTGPARSRRSPPRATGTSTRSRAATRSSSRSSTSSATTRPSSPRSSIK